MQIIHSAVQALARILELDESKLRHQLTGTYAHDWQQDPFSRGAYSYASVGGIDAAKALAAPVAETLYFAGEAANFEGYNGTVHGAMASGDRAARELLQVAGSPAATHSLSGGCQGALVAYLAGNADDQRRERRNRQNRVNGPPGNDARNKSEREDEPDQVQRRGFQPGEPASNHVRPAASA